MRSTPWVTAAAICWGAVVFPVGTSVGAEAVAEPEGIYTLGEVVVSGKTEKIAAGQTVVEVTEQDIRNKSARTLDEALQLFPGIDVRIKKKGRARLNIRGLPPREVRLFLNGIPINSAANGQFDVSLIPVESIAKIKVIRGAASVLYGPGALGGVVDIITKKGIGRTRFGLTSELGSNTERLVRGHVSGTYGRADYFVSGSHFSRRGFEDPNGGLRNNSDKERQNLFVNVGIAPNAAWSIGASFGYLNGEQGIPPSAIDDPSNIFASRPKFERLDNIDQKSGQIDVRYDPADPVDLRLSLYVNSFNQDDNLFDDDLFSTMTDPTVKTFALNDDSLVAGGQFQGRFAFGGAGVATVGLLARRESSTLEGLSRDVPTAGGGGGGGGGGGAGTFDFRAVDETHILNTFTTAAQYTVAPFEPVHLVLGYARHWFLQSDRATKTGNQFMASGSYELSDSLQVNAAYSRSFRFPSVDQLFDIKNGNRNLGSERASNVQAGLVWKPTDRNEIELTGFHNSVRGLIRTDKILDQFVNNDVLLRGVEVSWHTAPVKGLDVRTAYTFMDTEERATNKPLGLRPRHKIDFEANARVGDGWLAHLSVNYLADQVITSRTTPVQRKSLDDSSVVDVKVSKEFFDGRLALFVGADNVFNADNDIGDGFPLPGRFVFGGIRLDL